MRAWLLDALNSVYVKFLLKAGKWTLLFLFLLLLFSGLGFQFLLPRAIEIAKQRSNTQVVGSGSSAVVMFKDQALPKDFQGELEAEPEVLIYENQLRSTEDDDVRSTSGSFEDGPGYNANPINPAERRKIVSLASNFLSRWENFSPATTKQAYAASLAPFTTPEGLEQVTDREDNIQNQNIAPGSTVGSRWMTDGFTPDNDLSVRRYDGQTAYVTTLGEIETSGPSLVLSGARFIRSYALIVRRTDQGWKVERAVAQTRTEVNQ